MKEADHGVQHGGGVVTEKVTLVFYVRLPHDDLDDIAETIAADAARRFESVVAVEQLVLETNRTLGFLVGDEETANG